MTPQHLSFPASHVLDDVIVRLSQLPIPVFQDVFLDHVSVAIAKEQKLINYQPTYYRNHLAFKFERVYGRRMTMARTLERMLHELEMAAAYCYFAKDATAKPLRELLERALTHCARFDEIRAEERRKELKRNEARWRGGKARHATNDCACVRAARLIRVAAGTAGCTSPAQAARLIEARLVRFIRARRLSIVCEENLRRTIVRWIHRHPAVRAAYLTTCTAAA